MANQVLEGIAQDLPKIDAAIEEAEDLIAAMKEAGEDTSGMDAKLRDAKTRRTKWARMLEGRGILPK